VIDRLKILVVEDDPIYADFVRTNLQEQGHIVETTDSGAGARARAATLLPDAVILDLRLPDESGYDVARALRGGILPASAVIVLLTASAYPELDTADAVGIDIVITKPIERELVANMVRFVHERRRRKLEAAQR
jgi:DNA-binding response OmpR family regulator